MKKLISILVAFAMMATLAVTMAFAEPAAQSTSLSDSKITKTMVVPEGVPSPKASFDFTITPTEYPVSTGLTAQVETIDFTAASGTQTATKTLASFMSLTDDNADFYLSQPGVYVFTVAENDIAEIAAADEATTEGAYYIKDTDDDTVEALGKDTKTYTLRVYVVNEKVGEQTQLKIKSITVEDPTKEGADKDAKKVSPVDGFKFENVYTKTISPDDKVNGAFNISKTVDGVGDTAFPFPFNVKITLADVDDATTSIIGKVGTKEYEFNTANGFERKDVTLKHGEKLVFETLPAGASVSVAEQITNSGVQNAASYEVTNTGLITTSVKDAYQSTGVINAKGNVAVTNDLDESTITPEGILISNLPYIALALVAIGGLVAYVVIRRRNADEA